MKRIKTSEYSYFLSETSLKRYSEIFFTEFDDRLKSPWDVFVLINRKGYWDYKIFFPQGVHNKSASQLVISDRYLEKCSSKNLKKTLKGKNVIIYDDSLSNGSNLFYFFLMCENAEAKETIPVVYALNSQFPSEKSYQLMKRESDRIKDKKFWAIHNLDTLIKEFNDKLNYKLLLNDCDTDRLSRWQTELFQKNVSPLVMDLPIINHLQGNNEKNILLSEEQFDQLTQTSTDNWEFVKNIDNNLDIPIVASYFRYKDPLLTQTFPNLFHDFVVKSKYEKDQNHIKIVFTPFAIAKSITFKNVFDCFQLFYEGTTYADELLKDYSSDGLLYNEMEENESLCNALYRSVIYMLSNYIGRKFQQYVKETIGLELEYDWEIMADNFDISFIETQKNWHLSFDENKFRKLLLDCYDDGKINPIAEKKEHNVDKIKATQERINNHIRKRVIEKKKDITGSIKERIYTIEAIEYELDHYFYFKNINEKKIMVTNACLLFLETNSFSNYIFVDNDKCIIYRGFRYGENSEILLHKDLWFFYAYLHAYYNNCSENIKDGYQTFMLWLEEFLQKRRYMGTWITKDGFYFLRDYFGKMKPEELTKEIVKRRYLLDQHKTRKENDVRAKLIQEAAYIIKQRGEM